MDPGVSVQNQNFTRNTREACKSSWNPRGILKSFTLTIPWNLEKPVKIFPGIIGRRHHTNRKQNGIAERAVRRVKEGTSAVLLQSGLDENWWANSLECYTYLRNVTDLSSDGKTPYERRFGQPFKGPIIPFGSKVEYYPITAKGPFNNPSIWKESLTWVVPRIRFVRGVTLEGWHIGCRHWGVGNDGRIGNLLEKTQSMRKKWYFPNKENLSFRSQMDESTPLEEIKFSRPENPPWYGNVQFDEKVT